MNGKQIFSFYVQVRKSFLGCFPASEESPTNQPGGETPFQDDAAKMEWLSFAPSGASKNVAEQ